MLYRSYHKSYFCNSFILAVQFPARGSTQVLLCLFPGMLWLWHFLYSVGPHPVSSLHIYTLVVLRALMADAASQAGDADPPPPPRPPGTWSHLLFAGSVNVHRGALLLVPQRQCISSYVFYILHLIMNISWINVTLSINFDFTGKFTLLGITSGGHNICGTPNIPGVYTNVRNLLHWIAEKRVRRNWYKNTRNNYIFLNITNAGYHILMTRV